MVKNVGKKQVAGKDPPDFRTADERDEYFRKNAGYYTLVAKSGVGKYDRTEYNSIAEAEKAAQTRQLIGGGGGWLIYAVIGEQSALVKAIPVRGKNT